MTYYSTISFPSRPQDKSDKCAVDTKRAPPHRSHHGISFNIVSLVTKFEALDALSLPSTTSSHQPAPLQTSGKPPKQKVIAGRNYRGRLSTIFSAKRRSAEKDHTETSEEGLQSAYIDIFDSLSSQVPRTRDKKADSKKLRKAKGSYKPSNIRLRGEVWGSGDTNRGRGIGAVAAPYVENGKLDQKEGGSIREKVIFFDGTVSTGNSTRAQPSLRGTAAPNTPSSITRTRLHDKTYALAPSTGSSRRKCLQNQNPEAIASEVLKASPTRKEKMQIGDDRQQALAQSSPPSSVFVSNVNLRIMDSQRRDRNGQHASPTRSPIRNGRTLKPMKEDGNAMLDLKQYDPPGLGGDGTTPPTVAHDQDSRPLSRRRLSNRIEELYRAKSIEKKRSDSSRMPRPRGETIPSISQTKIALGLQGGIDELGEPRPNKLLGKVATLRRLFDGKISPVSASPEGPALCSTLDASSWKAASSPQRKAAHTVQLGDLTPAGLSRPPALPAPTLREVAKAPARDEKVLPVSSRPDRCDLTEIRKLQPTSPITNVPHPKSKFIVERIKKFETVAGTVPQSAHPRRGKKFRRRLSKSLRSLFEAPSQKSQEEELEQNTGPKSSTRPKRVVSPDGFGLVSRRDTIVSRWNNVPNTVSSGGDGTTSERYSASPDEEGVLTEMVVKGVECGLKQPRPVRALEIKRMALLCKDRMEEIMDREKGRVSQRRKS